MSLMTLHIVLILLLNYERIKRNDLRVGTMMMPLGFMVSLVDYPVYAGITFLVGFISLLELISIKKNKKIKL